MLEKMDLEHKSKWYKIMKIVLLVVLVVALIGILGDLSCDRNNENIKNTIVVTGHGEVNAVPDIASIYFTIRKEAKTVKEAQNAVAEVEKKALELLKTNNIAEKDIKTENASFNPKYEYRYSSVVCNQYGCPPNPGRNVIVGYEAYESISLKVRNIDDAGKVIEGLGSLGVTELSGPNFAIDEEDSLKADARKIAIDDAKIKAKVLAKDLGIRLGKITSFNENGNYPMPMYESGAAMKSADMMRSSITPELPKGENTISSDVTITYEIR